MGHLDNTRMPRESCILLESSLKTRRMPHEKSWISESWGVPASQLHPCNVWRRLGQSAHGCPGAAGLGHYKGLLPDFPTSQCNPGGLSKPTALPTALPETRPSRRPFQDLQLHGPAARPLPCQGLCRFLLQAALSILPLPTGSKPSLLLSSLCATCGQSLQPCCAVQRSCSWAELSLCTRALLP